MFELTPMNVMVMVGVFLAVAVTFIICIRRELR